MAHTLENGTILDNRYRIERMIGAGGMGHVYEARHLLIGRNVAVKTLHRLETVDDRAIRRIQREAKIVARLRNDHICEVLDMGTVDGEVPYFVMPLLIGRTLKQVLRDTPCLSLERTADIVCQILSALDAIHRENIIHRDLKPDNIFIVRMGERDDFVKVLDFGLSKTVVHDKNVTLTQSGTALGTPIYMAPEQAEGSKVLDHRIDIYAIGVLLYRMLTGKHPFEATSYNAVIAQILTKPFALPRSINDTIPRSVEKIILKAMSRDPSKRYETARDLRQSLVAAVIRRRGTQTTDVPTEEGTDLSGTLADVPLPIVLKRRSPFVFLVGGILLAILAAAVAVSRSVKTPPPVTNKDVVPLRGDSLNTQQANGDQRGTPSSPIQASRIQPDEQMTTQTDAFDHRCCGPVSVSPAPEEKGNTSRPSAIKRKRTSKKKKPYERQQGTSAGTTNEVVFGRDNTIFFADYGGN